MSLSVTWHLLVREKGRKEAENKQKMRLTERLLSKDKKQRKTEMVPKTK